MGNFQSHRSLPQLGPTSEHLKIHFDPVQNLEFIGVHFDSVTARAYLPLHKFVVLSNKANTIQLSPQTQVKNCLQLLGHIAASTFKGGSGLFSHQTVIA